MPGGFDELDENYLLMLGGPFAALVIGGAIARGKIAEGEIQKVSSPEAQVRDVLCDDNGRPDLVDTQFFVFSMAALIGVMVAFANKPDGVPAISGGLAMLSGAGALVYTGKKALDRNAPLIQSVIPKAPAEQIAAQVEVEVRGVNFVPAGAGGDLDALSRLRVEFQQPDGVWISRNVDLRLASAGATLRSAGDARGSVTNPTPTRVLARIPETLESGERQVRVVTAAGLPSPAFTIVVSSPSP